MYSTFSNLYNCLYTFPDTIRDRHLLRRFTRLLSGAKFSSPLPRFQSPQLYTASVLAIRLEVIEGSKLDQNSN